MGQDMGLLISKIGVNLWDIDIKIITVSRCQHIACIRRFTESRLREPKSWHPLAAGASSRNLASVFSLISMQPLISQVENI